MHSIKGTEDDAHRWQGAARASPHPDWLTETAHGCRRQWQRQKEQENNRFARADTERRLLMMSVNMDMNACLKRVY